MSGSDLHRIATHTLKAWAEDSKALMNHPRMPEKSNDPAYPGKDWYRQNYAEIAAELERRAHK